MNTLKVGDKIPKFECLDDKGNAVRSENFKGNKLRKNKIINSSKLIVSKSMKNL